MITIKYFAITCAPGAEQTCDWVLNNIQRREQSQIYLPLLVGSIALFLISVLLILVVLKRSSK